MNGAVSLHRHSKSAVTGWVAESSLDGQSWILVLDLRLTWESDLCFLCQRRPTPDFLCRRYVWDPLESNSEGKQDVVWKTRGEEEWCGAFLFLYFSTTRHLAFFSAALRSHWADSQSQTPSLFPNRCWTRGWINWVMDKVSKGVRFLTTGLGRRRSTRKNLRGVPALLQLGFALRKQMEKETASSQSMVSLHSFPTLLKRHFLKGGAKRRVLFLYL